MKQLFSTAATATTVLVACLLCLPFMAGWFIFWIIVGWVFQPPDRMANRYYRLAIRPLLLTVYMLSDGSPCDASMQSDRDDHTVGVPTVAGVYT